MARDWQAFDAELSARVPELVVELLGKPTSRAGQEWRWGRRGSLSVVIAGARAGMWFDHEAGEGGWLVDLVARMQGTSRADALDWTADRIGLARVLSPGPDRRGAPPAANTSIRPVAADPASTAPPPPAAPAPDHIERDRSAKAPDRTSQARHRAAAIWDAATPAPVDHRYLARKQVGPHGLRCDTRNHLVVPLQDVNGALHSLETISPDGAKRFLAGGAKRGHFCVIGTDPAAVAERARPFLICEGWATGASLHQATGLPVVAAMDAGNLRRVADNLRGKHPDAIITIVADNDAKPDRETNPGVDAARKAAIAIDARFAIPPGPGDANDLACAEGEEAVAAMVAAAAPVPPPAPTYPAPDLAPEAARAELAQALQTFMAEIPAYWRAVEDADDAAAGSPGPDPLDFNEPQRPAPPLLGLPVDVGLGKTGSARTAIAELLASGGLGARKVVYAVPRHDLGQEQVAAFRALGLRAMLWKGRTAPDPAPDEPERLMCRDPDSTFDALEVERPIEQSCCKVKRGGELHLCAHYRACGYQRQKADAQAAQVIVCAHDSLFHMKPDAIGAVGLLVIDEGFWQSGLRGLDGKAVLTQDGLEPGKASVTCYTSKGRRDVAATADLIAARQKLWKALSVTEPGPLAHGLLRSVGLTAEECGNAAGLERRRLRDPGLLPGMGPTQRRERIETVLPPHGQPWAPPGRCAALWRILADALEHCQDAGGAVLAHERTENGSVRALKLRWRAALRAGWAAEVPVLHLDATLRAELVRPYLSDIAIGAPVAATMPHVRVRQVLGSPTSAKALTPSPNAPERDRTRAAHHLRDLRAYIGLRARELWKTGRDADLLLVGQKAAIDALRSAGLPPRVDAVHFNGLSGLDRWGRVGGLIVLGRTLPAPQGVEALSAALTGRMPVAAAEAPGWWYGSVDRRLRLTGSKTRAVPGEVHADPNAEAIRWSICEAELIQAMGRGRGVNRTAATPLQIDLLTDVVLPVTVSEFVPWSELRPTRRDLMASRGAVLSNAADMAACFPDLWPNRDAAKKDAQRRGTNCYYRILYNSEMSPSSVEVTYRPAGAGHRVRSARFDLVTIPDPETWLVDRLGPLASCEIAPREASQSVVGDPAGAARLQDLGLHLTANVQAVLAARRAALGALAARLEAAKPAAPQRSAQFEPTEETEA